MGRHFISFTTSTASQDTISVNHSQPDSTPVEVPKISEPELIPVKSETININKKTARITRSGVLKKNDTVNLNVKQQITHIKNLIKEPDTVKQKKYELGWRRPEDFNKLLYKIDTDSSLNRNILTREKYHTIEKIPLKQIKFKENVNNRSDGIFWAYILIVLSIIWIQIFYKKYFSHLFNAVISYRSSIKLYNEKNVLVKRVSFILNLLYMVALGLFSFKVARFFDLKPMNFNNLELFFILLNIIIVFSLGKVIIHKLTGIIFYKINIINEYLHNVYVVNKSLGIILLPISFSAFYSSPAMATIFIYSGFIIIAITLLIKIIRSFQIIIRNDVFIFYTILYLCTLEILPILAGIKYLKSFI